VPNAQHVPLIARTRGGLPECVHYGSIAVVDAAGATLAALGERFDPQFTRSTLKPLQSLAFLREDGAARLGIDSCELAMLCSSHSGEDMHTAVVRGFLERAGAAPRDLRCGCHEPFYFSATGEPAPMGAHWSPLHHNCSGKHAGFLACCRLRGLPFAGYLDPAGPVQERVRSIVREYAAGDPLAEGVDGCSAPTFALPLPRIAHVYAQLAAGRREELRPVLHAMSRHPELVSGTGRFDLAVARHGRGDWVAKGGVDGIFCIGVRSRGLGIAVKVADGAPRAVHALAVEVLHQIGLIEDPTVGELSPHWRPRIRNAAGLPTGGYEPLFRLTRVH